MLRGHAGESVQCAVESVGCLLLLHLLAGIMYRRTFPTCSSPPSLKKKKKITEFKDYFCIFNIVIILFDS